MSSAKKRTHGFFLIEAIAGLSCIVLMSCLLWEAYRREVFQVVAAHVLCFEVRERVLGEERKMTAARVKEFLESSLGKEWAAKWEQYAESQFYFLGNREELKNLRLGNQPGLVVERWFRYPQILSFASGSGKKHHQEILKRCLLPLS